jgi:argininosuccinate synthase
VAKKIVLAYSGGLDTSVAIPWLQSLGWDVVTLVVNVGANTDLAAIQAKAVKLGVSRAYQVDARDYFAEHFIVPALKADALYEGVYPLASALSRPLIAELLVAVAHREGATAVAHGCTGKGNDQVRFDVAVAALDPELHVVAPVREWAFSRDQEIEYALLHGVEIPVTPQAPYSIDVNLWGRSVEGGVLEDPAHPVPDDAWAWTRDPDAASQPTTIAIRFEAGVPVALDGEPLGLTTLLERLNQVAGQQGVGRIDTVENRLVGIKSREVYEAPAAITLIAAHRALEQLVLTRDLAQLKSSLAGEYARLAYDGLWYSPSRQALDAFMAEANRPVTGDIQLTLRHGRITVDSRTAPTTLYRPDLATYGAGDAFDHQSAQGFVALFGLPLRTRARVTPVHPAQLDTLPLEISEAHQHA